MELDIAPSGQLHPQLWAPNQIRASEMLSAQLSVPVGSTSQYPHPMQMLPNGFSRLRLQRDWDAWECRTHQGRVWGRAKDPPAARLTSPYISHRGFTDCKDRGSAPQGIPYRAEPWMRRVTMWSPHCKAESQGWGLRAPSHCGLFR